MRVFASNGKVEAASDVKYVRTGGEGWCNVATMSDISNILKQQRKMVKMVKNLVVKIEKIPVQVCDENVNLNRRGIIADLFRKL